MIQRRPLQQFRGALADCVDDIVNGFAPAAADNVKTLAKSRGDCSGQGFAGLTGELPGELVGFGVLMLRLAVLLVLMDAP